MYALALHILDEHTDGLNVGDVVGEVGRHELGRVVRLQIGGLVSHPRVASGVRFVEGVGGEFLPVAPNLLQHFLVVSVGFALFDEFGFEMIQLVFLFLAHGLAQCVGLASCEVG